MANKRIESLYVDGVGPFSDFTIQFPTKQIEDEAEVHIFTGENGVGKSTLLYCLTAFVNRNDFIIPRVTTKGIVVITAINENISGYIKFIYEKSKRNHSGGSDFKDEDNFLNNINFPLFNSRIYDFAGFAYSSYRRLDGLIMYENDELDTNPLDGALSFSTIFNPKDLLTWIKNARTKEALAIKDKASEDSAKFSSNINKITKAIFEITGLNVDFELIYNPILKVIMKVDGVIVDFDTLPDGLKSIISWIADLLMRMDRIPWVNNEDVFDRNFILFLDEIEVHLHPAWQRKILPVVKKLFKNAQIFISTHSPFVIGSVDGAWVYKLKRDGQKSILDGEPTLSEDGKSYRLILQEIFGIEDDFGIEVEKELNKFYSLKRQILKGELELNAIEFQQLANDLAKQSKELETIIGMELRQLSRIKGQQTA